MEALPKETSAALELAGQAMKCSYGYTHQPMKPHTISDLVLLDAKGIETTQPSKSLTTNAMAHSL
jgi:hypothetical protein